jgi:hypothetical protein
VNHLHLPPPQQTPLMLVNHQPGDCQPNAATQNLLQDPGVCLCDRFRQDSVRCCASAWGQGADRRASGLISRRWKGSSIVACSHRPRCQALQDWAQNSNSRRNATKPCQRWGRDFESRRPLLVVSFRMTWFRRRFCAAGHFVSVGDGSLASVYLACS